MTVNQHFALAPSGRQLEALLHTPEPRPSTGERTFHVESIGGTFYFAYEQLRNATEYREHHLLLRGAIERFLVREVHLRQFHPIAHELITDLTQAGYLQNDSVPLSALDAIDHALRGYSAYFTAIVSAHAAPAERVAGWLLQIASVQIETIISPNIRLASMMRFAFEHYLSRINAADFTTSPESQEYQLAVYCAMQRAIFKSDIPTTRYYWSSSHLTQAQAESPQEFVSFNQAIDGLYQAPLTNRIERLINRYGAPMRLLRELVVEEAIPASQLSDHTGVITRIKAIARQRYSQVHARLRSRIGKTILFILLTKVLIGLVAEVPYDLWLHNAIAWLPLIVNVMLPIAYMALLGLTIKEPGPENTTVITSWISRILYETPEGPVTYRLKKRVTSSSLQRTFNVIYALGFMLSISLVGWLLYRLGFNAVNGIIFVIFFSAVSFLGFRLRQTSRELAMLDEGQGIVRALTDFLSSPFVRLGHWLSDRYARINIVTRLLDVAIEMPLKTTLRLIQQWIGFMRDKQEEI